MRHRKLIILLSLLVILPLTLLAWQGWKINQDTQQLNDARFMRLVSARLNQVDTVVQSYFEEMQLKWSLSIPQWQLDSTSTRKRIESDGNIRQIFVLNPQRIRTFPPRENDITSAEKLFVDRLDSIWRDPEILFSNQNGNVDLEQVVVVSKGLNGNSNSSIIASVSQQKQSAPLARSYESAPLAEIAMADSAALSESVEQESFAPSSNTTSDYSASRSREISPFSAAGSAPKVSVAKKLSKRLSSKVSSKPVSNANKQGWYMWHWGNDANLIFWQEGKDSSIVGVEMEPSRVKADLISRLPDTLPNEHDDFRLRLLDTAGQVVYQWGNFDIVGSQQKAQQRRALNYPLSSWSLEYYGEPFSQSNYSKYNLLLSFLAFTLLLLGLAWFLFREQTREMRLAENRVQFVSQVSHELKTPLTNIRMYAEMLESQVDDAEQPKRYLQVITDESKRLTRMISNVLTFSHEPRVHKREIDADTVIRQSIEHFTPSFVAKNIELNVELSAQTELICDPDLLEQIMNNLLSNVEKYAASGKRVDIKSDFKNDAFVVSVRDYGSGISRAERKQIFKPFYRIDDQITEGVSGTGIGLTIARQQAENLGGSLEYIDVEGGACFELTLPLVEA